MSIAIVTGATGLVGTEAVRLFHAEGMDVVGIDNDMRRRFFGGIELADRTRTELAATLRRYSHVDRDIRDEGALSELFARYGKDISVVIHAAAQPSHDWAAEHPLVDFAINANGTLLLLEATRKYCREAVFIYCSTNKLYGSRPNDLPLVESETRWELEASHPYFTWGIPEVMSIDGTSHSLFGVSKAAADLMVQEYGLYFGMNTVIFRAGCVTGAAQRGAMQHGFLAYLAECVVTGRPYEIIGHKGKQVRDNMHARDLASAFMEFFRNPRKGEVYNMGGGRMRSCSVLEAADRLQNVLGRRLQTRYNPHPRSGDHIWWITDTRKFCNHYTGWNIRHSLDDIIDEFALASARQGGDGRIVAGPRFSVARVNASKAPLT